VVGIDLSKSVDAAYQNTREFPKAHIVQADIYNLPFRQETFDFVYSIGVLHHLPSPEEGFNKLLGFLKREGEVRFYVYRNLENEPKWKRFLLSIVTVVRKLTTRMPHNLLCGLSFSIAAIVYLIFVLPYKMLSKLTMAKQFAETLPLKQYANYSFRVCYNDVLDRFSAPIENRYSQHEVRAWLERAGLEDISVTSYFGWLGHGRKACKDKG
jgi:SAM-dependent methyltransferase